ncbi:Calcium/calmodulin-regulated receptor-like kinase 1 [Asimina triloba]
MDVAAVGATLEKCAAKPQKKSPVLEKRKTRIPWTTIPLLCRGSEKPESAPFAFSSLLCFALLVLADAPGRPPAELTRWRMLKKWTENGCFCPSKLCRFVAFLDRQQIEWVGSLTAGSLLWRYVIDGESVRRINGSKSGFCWRWWVLKIRWQNMVDHTNAQINCLVENRRGWKMKGVSWGLIVGVSVGVIIGVLLAISALFCMRIQRRRARLGSSSSRRAATIPIRANGADSCTTLSDSTIGQESPKPSESNGISFWLEGSSKKKSVLSVSGILKYPYKYFGHGAFGPVYKAQLSTGETVAVKVLANNSKQGEKEFQTEVLLLGRLHHRNLVNLVGYCTEKGETHEPLSWDSRVHIALDVARGLEYLHDGAVPPVMHRDIKSSNVLLDQFMKARKRKFWKHCGMAELLLGQQLRGTLDDFFTLSVADFGLSREDIVEPRPSTLKGTYGYLDPEYVSTRSFTKKSDIYSFGVLLFELIAGRSPQQGLMDYVELAALDADGKVGWEEIADSRLDGKYDVQELNEMASLAYKCISPGARKRPPMRDIVQTLSRIIKRRHNRKHQKPTLPVTMEEVTIDVEQLEVPAPMSEHRREDSIDAAQSEVMTPMTDHHREESIDSTLDLQDV